jgi:2-oxoisovalerate dehydrogenase E1 component beta subunit
MNLYQAINDGLSTILEGDSKAVIFGEDVSFGGVFRCTTSLQDRFGSQRVFNTPLTEQGIMGFAIGLASSGYTALPEIQFADYLFPAFDQLHNEASKLRYRSGGAESFNSGNLVVRMPCGAVGHGGLYHSQSPEGFFLGMQGVKVVIPRGPIQAKGLLIAAARAGDPIVFMEPKILYRGAVEEVPMGEYELPIGKAEVLQKGKDVTLISYGTMVYTCEMAAKAAKEKLGVDVEVIDLRTVHPWDKKTVVDSVNKTGRCVVVHEASRTGGIGESVGAEVQERCFLRLEAPVTRVTGWDVPMPLVFESLIIPDVASKSSVLRSWTMPTDVLG